LVEGVSGGWQKAPGRGAAREANSDEVKARRSESAQLEEALAETLLENRLLKKSSYGAGGDDA
jgi:transposase